MASDINHKLFGLSIPQSWWPKWWKRGETRECFTVGKYVIKTPTLKGNLRCFVHGVDGNLQERQFYRYEKWPELCPVLFSFLGLISILRYARPLTEDEWHAVDFEAFVTRGDHYAKQNLDGWNGNTMMFTEPESLVIPAENKISSFGMLDGRVVAIDYGY